MNHKQIREAKLLALQEEIRQYSGSFRQAFGTPDGKIVLERLEDLFDDVELMGEDPYKTARNIGRRDVVRFIQQMINNSEKRDG